ncbi:MAG: hypothetical protein KKC84_05295, partial [Candidatus Omnitrophica bacterium]|nr:hypothetical protein [Candidatus Omnitrophota bacterium]
MPTDRVYQAIDIVAQAVAEKRKKDLWIILAVERAISLTDQRIKSCSLLEYGVPLAAKAALQNFDHFKANLSALERLAQRLHPVNPYETLQEAARLMAHFNVRTPADFNTLIFIAESIPALYKETRDKGFSDESLRKYVEQVIGVVADLQTFSQIIAKERASIGQRVKAVFVEGFYEVFTRGELRSKDADAWRGESWQGYHVNPRLKPGERHPQNGRVIREVRIINEVPISELCDGFYEEVTYGLELEGQKVLLALPSGVIVGNQVIWPRVILGTPILERNTRVHSGQPILVQVEAAGLESVEDISVKAGIHSSVTSGENNWEDVYFGARNLTIIAQERKGDTWSIKGNLTPSQSGEMTAFAEINKERFWAGAFGENVIIEIGAVSSPISDRLHDEIVTRANALVIANRYGNPGREEGQLFQEYVPDSTIGLILEKISTSARAVIFGLRPAALSRMSLVTKDIEALEEAFFVLNHIAGVNIKVVDLGDRGVYVYDEYALVKKLRRKDFLIGVTESGMEQLIRRDMRSVAGVFYRLVEEFSLWNIFKELVSGYNGKIEGLNELLEEGLWKRQRIKRKHRIGIKYLVTCTYGRPKALDNAIKMYTQNLELFGHKEDITLFILDNTPADANARPGDRAAAFGNREVVRQYQERGFKIRYLSREEQEYLRKEYVKFLVRRYATSRGVRRSDPQTQADLIAAEQARVEEFLEGRFTEIINYAFATQNIAGARTVTVALTEGNMGNFDDDSLPQAAVVTKEMRRRISEERRKNADPLIAEMRRELSAGMDEREVLERYFAYSPDGSTGLIPQALGQMRQVRSEQRLRFQREHNRGQAQTAFGDPSILDEEEGKDVWLVTTEDDVQLPLQHTSDKALGLEYDDEKAGEQIPDYNAQSTEENDLRVREGDYDLLPVDFLWVGDQTLGRYTGQHAVGVLASDDERGTGIQPLRQAWIARKITDALDRFPESRVVSRIAVAYSWITSTLQGAFPGSELLRRSVIKRAALCSMHFNNARDNAAEALFNESYNFWHRHNNGVVDPRDLQQVVMMTVHMGVRGLNSIRFTRWNQDCFNLKTMRLPLPIPTNGAWLRTEEPYYKELVEFIFTGYSMAWARVVGGHKRLPGERRPNVSKQSLWEEMAMVAWDLYDLVFLQLFRTIRFALILDPYRRLRILGR